MGDNLIHDLDRKLQEGTLTVADLNLVIEASRKSAQERLHRQLRPLDGNRMTDPAGHSRIAPPSMAARVAPRKGGGKTNDPRRTSTGRAMLRRQRIRSEAKQDLLQQALELIRQYATADDLYGLWWNPKQQQLRVSNGDWAEYETAELLERLQQLLGQERVEMDSELGAPAEPGWDQIDLDQISQGAGETTTEEQVEPTAEPMDGGGIEPEPEQLDAYKHADLITLPEGVEGTNCGNCKFSSTHQDQLKCGHHDLEGFTVTSRMCCSYWDNSGVKRAWKQEQTVIEATPGAGEGPTESAYPSATFRVRHDYEPICPHCHQVMYEKHYVPDHEDMKARIAKISTLPREDIARMWPGNPDQPDVDLGAYLFRHRGECYDKGPFTLNWPQQEKAEPSPGGDVR